MKKIVLAVLTLSLLLSACATETGSNTTNGKLNIVTTTGMIADIVINVGGEHVEVTSLMGPGVDPHLYKASEGDIRRLQEANLIFYNGLHLEAQLGEVLEKMNDFNITTVAVADEIDPAILLSHPQYEDAYDPHIWFDVTLWMQAVRRVQETLSETDPAHKSAYEANATAYLAQLEELHQYVFSQAESIPAEKRVIITAHDAFSYFGRAYGFEVRGLQGISTESQAGTADVQALAEFIVEQQIPAIFVESSVPQRNVEAVQAAVQSQGFDVQIGGSLFSDAMGSEGTPEGTYIGMVRHNIDTIVTALKGE
ncbi:MAG TPA: zinc ABC transporter substrate-binding protein [Anaerolineales bacterium]|nr:zinc ABC transporter substrate-binding protein [Anaerolineales bacterium]HRK91684.1 zinc ABC transporter substrate-binding protein [Anaerolineales bacterium]